jgi:hypothetical protein
MVVASVRVYPEVTLIVIILLLIVLICGWLATLIGMPGNWLMLAAISAFTYWALPEHGAGAWSYTLSAAILALIGELVEFGASAAGLAKGGSKRGAALAMIGAIIGSLVGAALGLPIPIIGSVIGIVVCSAVGAMLGAVLGEVWKGKNLGLSVTIGRAAFWGRLIGTGAKLICSSIILILGTVLIVNTWAR